MSLNFEAWAPKTIEIFSIFKIISLFQFLNFYGEAAIFELHSKNRDRYNLISGSCLHLKISRDISVVGLLMIKCRLQRAVLYRNAKQSQPLFKRMEFLVFYNVFVEGHRASFPYLQHNVVEH